MEVMHVQNSILPHTVNDKTVMGKCFMFQYNALLLVSISFALVIVAQVVMLQKEPVHVFASVLPTLTSFSQILKAF
jgi:hypothetical protein